MQWAFINETPEFGISDTSMDCNAQATSRPDFTQKGNARLATHILLS